LQTVSRFNLRNPWLLLAGAIAIVLFIGLIALVIALQPMDRLAKDAEVEFTIAKGDGLKEVVDELDKEELIKSTEAFKLYALLSGKAHLFKPGHYKLNPSWNSVQIAKVLIDGPPEIAVVIFEGETVKDIDFRLSSAGIIEAGELDNYKWQKLAIKYPLLREAKSLEGFIFPDTYRFAPFSDIDIVVREFLNNFEKQAIPLFKDEFAANYQSLIIASLVEKEAPFFEDRKIITGIIYRRMTLGMKLQLDATTVYEKCGERFATCPSRTRRLSRRDLASKGVYNTYLNKGLPPTPIANPGLSAIKAALNPVKTRYIFYISHPRTRKTIFAATLDEHNRNRVKYLR
jgi:UPF0755 protein